MKRNVQRHGGCKVISNMENMDTVAAMPPNTIWNYFLWLKELKTQQKLSNSYILKGINLGFAAHRGLFR